VTLASLILVALVGLAGACGALYLGGSLCLGLLAAALGWLVGGEW
jgi:hypothetical protein